MYRQLMVIVCVLAMPALASAQDTEDTQVGAEAAEPAEAEEVTQQLAGNLGLAAGGRTSPGGLSLGGSYLYRLTDRDWLDAGVSFSFGSGSAACFTDRDGSVLCDHGLLKGFAAELSGAIRREFPGQGTFTPFASVGLAVRLVSFGDDDVKGAAFPVVIGGGVRSQVAERIAIVGGATLRAGIGVLSGDVGLEPHLSLTVLGGVEFALD